MESYQQTFIRDALQQGALRFGEFTLKSGRTSPYFFNTGAFNSGASMARLGQAYAAAIVAAEIEFDMLFGPAYKGIPLATAVAIALAEKHGLDVPVCFNRKEAKDHGEGGNLLGAPLEGRVLIVDDVISAGTSVNESMELINGAGARAAGVMISLDRQERGSHSELSAAMETAERHGIAVTSIVGLNHVFEFLEGKAEFETTRTAIENYRKQYGA